MGFYKAIACKIDSEAVASLKTANVKFQTAKVFETAHCECITHFCGFTFCGFTFCGLNTIALMDFHGQASLSALCPTFAPHQPNTSMMPAQTIAEVIAQLEDIVEEAVAAADPLGLFALLYLDVTRDVAEGIRLGRFENGPRMERLDVIFANRYLDAYRQYRRSEPCTQCWETAFVAAQKQELLVLQHLFMGMNAHINLDLGIASVEAAATADIAYLEGDFMVINKLLSDKIDVVQDKLGKVSPLLFLVDWFGKRKDERFAEFSLIQARNHAWRTATRLSGMAPAQRQAAIAELDGYVAALNRLITRPGRVFGGVLRVVKRFEKKDMKRILEAMK
jgi:hypothetical protein